jgi:hypothetical protein
MGLIKRIASATVLLFVLTFTAFAGDMPQTGYNDPPKCTENCPASTSSSSASSAPLAGTEEEFSVLTLSLTVGVQIISVLL